MNEEREIWKENLWIIWIEKKKSEYIVISDLCLMKVESKK
jgi:hypothetical protein